MTRFMLAATIAVATLAGSAADAQRRRAPADPGAGRYGTLAIVSAGGEQALRFGDVTLPRPFGGELVDSITLLGRYPVGTRDLYLVKGAGAAACPARYVIITSARRTAPIVSDPFGTCGDPASPIVSSGRLIVAMPQAGTTAPARFAYADGTMQRLDVAPIATAGTAAAPATCRLYRQPGPDTVGYHETGDVLASFRSEYPQELRRRSKVEKADLSALRLQEIVTGLACLATWPGADPLVPDAARPLFISRRYGAQAFSWLDTVSRNPMTSEPLRAATRSFAAQMYFQASLE